MYIIVTEKGLKLLEPAPTPMRMIEGTARYYYVGGQGIPVVVVVRGQSLQVGQIWDTSSGNETGFLGFCRPDHAGMKIGKLTFRRLLDLSSLPDDEQIQPLGLQLRYFMKKFLPLRRGEYQAPSK